jgi:GNAT superfamily N-acetyltransferase
MTTICACNDIEILTDLNKYGHDHHQVREPQIFKPFDRVAVADALLELIEKPNYYSYVAYNGKIPVGYIIIFERYFPENKFRYGYKSIFIDQFAVIPEYRKKGIGSLLLKKIEEIAEEKHVDKIELNCWDINHEAIRLYKKNKYKTLYTYYVKEI